MSLQRYDQQPKPDSIQELISDVVSGLTPTERRIAAVVVGDPTLIAFGTVSDLATKVETSRPSIVRFANKLGFEGYTHLQAWVRKGVVRQLSKPSERVRQGKAASASPRQAIINAAVAAADALSDGRLRRHATLIAEAQSVWIISGESSRAGAHVLLSGLSMVRPHVKLIEHNTLGRDLCHASEADVAVVFDFARYRRSSISAARAIVRLGVPLIAITDSALSPLAALTPSWCELKIPAVGPFDSSLPAVAAAEMLIAEVVELLGDVARERLDRLEHHWQAIGHFHDGV